MISSIEWSRETKLSNICSSTWIKQETHLILEQWSHLINAKMIPKSCFISFCLNDIIFIEFKRLLKSLIRESGLFSTLLRLKRSWCLNEKKELKQNGSLSSRKCGNGAWLIKSIQRANSIWRSWVDKEMLRFEKRSLKLISKLAIFITHPYTLNGESSIMRKL